MKKRILFVILIVFVVSLMSLPVSALSSITYTDVASTSSNATNLINYAMAYDDFIYSDYVIYSDVNYSYYIVWSDELEHNNGTVTGQDIQYVHYYRTGSTGSYSYVYDYGTDSDFKLNVSHICTSNIPEFGFHSSVFADYYNRYVVRYILILICSFGFVSMIILMRGKKS